MINSEGSIVTVFKNIWDTTEPLYMDVNEIFKRIKDGNSEKLITQVRTAKDKDERQKLKMRLHSICFSGRFGKREAEFLLEHSGLICLDIDYVDLKNLEEVKKKVCDDEYVFGCFVSPGGAGLKVIIKIAPDKSNHKSQFLALEKHFNKTLNPYTSSQLNQKKLKGKTVKIDANQGDYLFVHIDKSGKDINRVCYESYDPNIYYNADSDDWYETLEETTVLKEVDDYDLIIEKLQTWINNKESYYEGNRNQFLYQFASAMCRYGISEMRCISYLHSNYADYPFKELETTAKGAYKANDYGTQQFTEKEKQSKITTVKIEDNKPVTAFWTINEKGRVKIDVKQFLKFIETNGFGRTRQFRGDKKWQFVHVNNMIVDIVDVTDIKNHILDYVMQKAPDPVFDELQMKNRYFENTFLNALPLIEVEQIRDTATSSYIFFEDFYYEITEKSMDRRGYLDLDGKHIWRKQVCKKTITELVDYTKHDFNQFVYNAMNQDDERYFAAITSLGYGIHTYKKKRLAKLVYACDEGIGELDGMACGGSGKNLFIECLKYVRSVVDLDGKDFDKRDKFKFQTVSDDTQIIAIDDYEGDIKEMFTKVTGHFEVEKKGMDKTVMEFERSPKLYVSSNTAPKGFSDSFARRLNTVEFSNHYNANHTPSHDFGDKDFFSDDWNQADYNALYSFLFKCVQYYLKHGIKEVVGDTTEKTYKQLVKNTGRDFAEYFKDYDMAEFENGREVYDAYKSGTGDDASVQQFYGNIRKMCSIFGWKFETKGRGKWKEIQIIK